MRRRRRPRGGMDASLAPGPFRKKRGAARAARGHRAAAGLKAANMEYGALPPKCGESDGQEALHAQSGGIAETRRARAPVRSS